MSLAPNPEDGPTEVGNWLDIDAQNEADDPDYPKEQWVLFDKTLGYVFLAAIAVLIGTVIAVVLLAL